MRGKSRYNKIERDELVFLELCRSEDIEEGKGKRFFFGEELDMQIMERILIRKKVAKDYVHFGSSSRTAVYLLKNLLSK